jgi:hypothetical protein
MGVEGMNLERSPKYRTNRIITCAELRNPWVIAAGSGIGISSSLYITSVSL